MYIKSRNIYKRGSNLYGNAHGDAVLPNIY